MTPDTASGNERHERDYIDRTIADTIEGLRAANAALAVRVGELEAENARLRDLPATVNATSVFLALTQTEQTQARADALEAEVVTLRDALREARTLIEASWYNGTPVTEEQAARFASPEETP